MRGVSEAECGRGHLRDPTTARNVAVGPERVKAHEGQAQARLGLCTNGPLTYVELDLEKDLAGSARGTGQRAKETLPVLWGWRKSEADLT